MSEVLSQTQVSLPLTPAILALFISHLHNIKLAPATIATYISAIGYSHKIQNLADPTDNFLIQRLLHATKKVNPRYDVRLPITKEILKKLVDVLPSVVPSYYMYVAIKCMFLLGFHAFLRISEMIYMPNQSQHYLHKEDINILYTNSKHSQIQVTFRSFKHNSTCKPHYIILQSETNAPSLCPVKATQEYIKLRGDKTGPLFARPNGVPLIRSEFMNIYNNALKVCDLDPKFYKGHSFRIGASTTYVAAGWSDAQIRHRGQWHTNAFKKYVRM